MATRKLVFIDGEAEWLTQEELIERGLVKPPKEDIYIANAYSESRPWKGMSFSCPPELCEERNAILKANDVHGAYFDPTKKKNFIATSRGARRDAMKALGLHDEDGGYGDG